MTKAICCDKCGKQTTGDNHYKGLDYCSKCYASAIAYESDSLRKKYDIRNRDFKSLNTYQQAQRRMCEEMVNKNES